MPAGGQARRFPCIGLIVSGGHTSLYRCRGPLEFEFLGGTIDDAAGEAFDKVAAMLGLPYPGGPSIQRTAEGGDPHSFALPRAFLHDDRLDFSFSGLKTAVRYAIEGKPGEGVRRARGTEDVGGKAVGRTKALPANLLHPLPVSRCRSGRQLSGGGGRLSAGQGNGGVHRTGLRTLCVGGGVAANARFRQRLDEECKLRRIELHVAQLQLCTDNAVMGAMAIERWKAGLVEPLDLDILPGVIRSPQR